MLRITILSAAIGLLLVSHVLAAIPQRGKADSILRSRYLTRISPSCSKSIRSPTLTTQSKGFCVVGGGNGNISSITEQEDDELNDEVPSNVMQDHTQIKGGATTQTTASQQHHNIEDPSSIPLRISLRKGKQVVVDTRMDTRLQKKLIRQKRKEEEESHRQYASNNLKNRNHLNLSRKIVHAGFGLFFTTLNHFLPRDIFLPIMTTVTSGTLIIELVRYRKGFGWVNTILISVLGGSLRKHEMEGKFTGAFYYFLGVTITAASFPNSCASLGICQLALADPSASFFGRQTKDVYWSRIENGFFGIGRNKGLLGFMGGALFCFPFNYRVLSVAKFGGTNTIPGGQRNLAVVSLALGLAGAFADLCVPSPALTMPKKIIGIPMPPLHVDDNVVVPIFSGYACTKIFQYIGWTDGVDLARIILFK